MNNTLLNEGFINAKHITVTASGDPFASPTYRKLLQSLTEDKAPELQSITIITNGILLKKYWHTMTDFVKRKVHCVSVSIDAASPEVYAINRRGGNWSKLLENLKFLRYGTVTDI